MRRTKAGLFVPLLPDLSPLLRPHLQESPLYLSDRVSRAQRVAFFHSPLLSIYVSRFFL